MTATTTQRFKTDLRCAACVELIRPLLDDDPQIEHWQADVRSADKTITVDGPAGLKSHVDELLSRKGYRVLAELPAMAGTPAAGRGGRSHAMPSDANPGSRMRDDSHSGGMTHGGADRPTSYFPLVLILAYLVVIVGLLEWQAGALEPMRAMRTFMAGFFLVFSFFKLLDLSAFAMAYQSYDVVAARWPAYAYCYPFIEAALGIGFLLNWQPLLVNVLTLIVMLVSSVGVIKTLMAGRKIQCACLGTVFNLPMSVVTLVEDFLMVGMSAAMIDLLLRPQG